MSDVRVLQIVVVGTHFVVQLTADHQGRLAYSSDDFAYTHRARTAGYVLPLQVKNAARWRGGGGDGSVLMFGTRIEVDAVVPLMTLIGASPAEAQLSGEAPSLLWLEPQARSW